VTLNGRQPARTAWRWGDGPPSTAQLHWAECGRLETRAFAGAVYYLGPLKGHMQSKRRSCAIDSRILPSSPWFNGNDNYGHSKRWIAGGR
jgi:hypothetical protein